MGKLVASAKEISLDDLYDQYQTELMRALKFKTTIKKNVDVLLHIMGYFKKLLSSDEKQELLEIVDNYRNGHVPLIVPVTLMNHYVRKYDQDYLRKQYYLSPHPVELNLRNHVWLRLMYDTYVVERFTWIIRKLLYRKCHVTWQTPGVYDIRVSLLWP